MVKHVVILYRPDDVFYRAFKSALNIAKQNDAKITLVKIINYPAGFGIGTTIIMDAVTREYEIYKFNKILPDLERQAMLEEVNLQVAVLDMRLSPAKAFVDFASKNDVDLMVVGSIRKKGWKKYLDSDISEEIMGLNPQCNMILVE